MPLFFAHPAAAWLLPAVGLPIVFHLFFRLRRQVREFPSLMFFVRIDPRLSAKRKIHEWIVLCLRCLFIALLVLALMRPTFGTRSLGDHVARLVLIDNSGSMAANGPGGLAKLRLAARATEAVLDSARPGDVTAVQLMSPDAASTLSGNFESPAAAIRDTLGRLTPTDGPAPIAKAIRLALATLGDAKAPQHELDIVTDLQKKNWTRGELGPEASGCRVIVHRIESAPLAAGSVSLESAEMPSRSVPAGRITPVRLVLRNVGAASAHVRLNSVDDSGKNTARELDLAPGTASPATLTFSFPNPGFHWAQVWLEGDAALSASRVELGFFCTEVRKAVFAGNKSDFGALPYALAPGGNADLSGIEATYTGVNELRVQLAANPLSIALAWDDLAAAETSTGLEQYVRKGGTLFLVPAPEAGLSIARASPAWLQAKPGALLKAAEPQPMVLLRPGDPFWHDLLDASGQPKLGTLRVFQYLPLATSSEWQTLMASSRGETLLARRSLDRGQIFASGLAFTPKWSSLPLKAGFVVLMQNAVFGAASTQLPVRSAHAGEELAFDEPNVQAAVRSLAGGSLDWRGLAHDFVGLPRAGVYEITQHDHSSWLAVSADADQADPHFLPLAPVPLLHNLPHVVAPLVHADDMTRAVAAEGSGTSLFRWLLLMALLVLLVETWLANERSSDLGRELFASMRQSAQVSKQRARKEMAKA